MLAIIYILGLKQPLTLENLLGINIAYTIKRKYYKFFNILRITALKQITRLWKQPQKPEVRLWYNTIEKVLEMEKNIFASRNHSEKWNKLYPNNLRNKMYLLFDN